MNEHEKIIISKDSSKEAEITSQAEPLPLDDRNLALCLRAVRFQRAFMNWKDHRYLDVPNYGVALNAVGEALYELNYLMGPVYKAIPKTQSIISGILTLIEETNYALDQYDHGDVTEETIEELKQDCDRLISIIFEDFLRIKLSDLNSAWVSIINSRVDDKQLKIRDEMFLREASEKGVFLFKESAG